MRPDGANSPKEQSLPPSLPARIDAADVTKTNEVNDISTDVETKIKEFFSQGSEDKENISKGEKEQLGSIKTSLMNLYYKVRYQYVRAEDEAAKTYKKLADNLLGLIQKATSAIEGNNPYEVASYEPDDTDSNAPTVEPSKKTEITAKALRIPDRKFQAISDNKIECEQIKREYAKCLDNPYQSNRKKASDLKCFQAKYEQQLKNVASSINSDGEYEIKNLFDQVSCQIRYYDKLADKDLAQNKQDAIDTMTALPKPPSEEQVNAALRPEGPDPRIDWAQIGPGGNIQN